MNKEWSKMFLNIQNTLKKVTFEDGIKNVLDLRNSLYKEIISWKKSLNKKDYYAIPFINQKGYHNKTIAYSIYHIFRIEDIVLSSLILKEDEIFFTSNYKERLNSSIITTGNELVKKEISDFSEDLNIDELYNYIKEVKEKTDKFLLKIKYEDLKIKFNAEDKERLENLNVVSKDEIASFLIPYWTNKDIKGLILMPFTRHHIMHVEAAIRIINKIK